MDFRIICFKNKSWAHRPSAFYQQNRYRLRSHIAHMGSGRCQTQTDTKPIAIYVKSDSSCVPIHGRHMNIQLHLNFSSGALPKSCHLHTAKSIVFNVAVWGQNRFYLIGTSIVFWGALQTKIKPIQSATCKLACGSLRPIQNRQQSVAKSYLSCVPIHSHSQTCTFSSA